MKRTTRFITLVLTLILALSCSMQIFAEEIQRLPVEPIFSTEPCSHNLFFSLPQSYMRYEDPTQTDRSHSEYPLCLTGVYVAYDTNTCSVCNHVWYTNRTIQRYIYSHVFIDGSCFVCNAPKT